MAWPDPKNINTLEKEKFVECPVGETAVRVKQCEGIVTTPSGLFNGGLITEVPLNAVTWTALPATALTDRNAITIQNQSLIEIKINYSSSVVGYVGVKVGANGERMYDIQDDIVLYAKSASGTPTIVVEEIS